MGYDPKAVRVKKEEKVIAIMSFNKDRERHYIRETVKSVERNSRMKSTRNKSDKED
jgi:hypothetical protein